MTQTIKMLHQGGSADVSTGKIHGLGITEVY